MVTMNLSNTENSTNAPEGTGLMEKLKFLEEEREKSFKYWQYGINDNCSIKKVCLYLHISLVTRVKAY